MHTLILFYAIEVVAINSGSVLPLLAELIIVSGQPHCAETKKNLMFWDAHGSGYSGRL